MRDEPVAAAPAASTSEPADPDPRPARDQADAGWVGIPNKGRIPSEVASTAETLGRSARRGPESGSSAAFPEDADARGGNNPAGPRTGLGLAVPDIDPREAPKAGAGSARVESLLHVVDRGENFWTISRLYYGSGDYYRALWKANSRRYPNIAEIHIKDVILIPPVEDLDPAYIGPPPRRRSGGRGAAATGGVGEIAGSAGTDPAGPETERPRSFLTTRTASRSGAPDGLPVRRGARVEAGLELPDAGAEEGPARGHRGAPDDGIGTGDDGAPATRLTARPRGPAPVDRPVYKVRRHDTLRSIARDVLGDSRRADELYDLNRDVIADPSRLTPGQILELPDDADARRLTVRNRYRADD
jgi:nucleoid-associated protein YgaU